MYFQRCYYLSMEYYMGRSLTNAMVNLGIDSSVEEAIYEVSSFSGQVCRKDWKPCKILFFSSKG